MLRQRRAAWLVALPVATASWLAAHCAALVLVPPANGELAHSHAEGAHTFCESAPLLIAVLVTVLAAGLVLCVGDALRGSKGRHGPPARLFAVLPPLGFVVVEHIETLLGSGSISPGLVTQPEFVTGLALQLPSAVLALLLCRGLYALGYGLGRLLARQFALGTRVHWPTPWMYRRPRWAPLVSPSVLALAHGSRAPPAPACP